MIWNDDDIIVPGARFSDTKEPSALVLAELKGDGLSFCA